MTRAPHPAARLATLSIAAAALLLALPVAAGPALDRAAGYVVEAHAQLVSSSPAAGEILPAPPTELRLVFSEPFDPRYTSLDLVDDTGVTVLSHTGAADPADPHVLVAAVPAAADAASHVMTVRWRTLSAADGHVARGFFSYGVGEVAASQVLAAGGGSTGDLHGGHSAGIAVIEVPAKLLAYGGAMLAVGLAILALIVLRPAMPGAPVVGGAEGGEPADRAGGVGAPTTTAQRRRKPGDRRASRDRVRARPGTEGPPSWSLADVLAAVPWATGSALLVGGVGCLVLLTIAIASLPDASGPADVAGFITGSRSGALLAARIGIGVAGGALVLAVRRWRGPEGAGGALWLGAGAGLASLVLTATGSHAAAFASPVPMLVDVVHLVAISVWLSGLGLLAALTDFGRHSRLAAGVLRSIVPRFSALAIVSVAVIALTGAYADWVMTGDPLGSGTAYQLNLLVKIAVFLGALALGALNFLDGGAERRWLGGLSRRLVVELAAGVAVLAIASNLTSGSPTSLDRPVPIQAAAGTTDRTVSMSLAVLPGRPGPNLLVAEGGVAGLQGTTELVLQRLDTGEGIARIPMRADPSGADGRFVVGQALPAGGRWDATIVSTGPDGQELGRRRFVFALDATSVSEGRSLPPVSPVLLVAMLLVGLGVFGIAFALAGGILPRTQPAASRSALLGSGAIGIALGVVIIVLGGPR